MGAHSSQGKVPSSVQRNHIKDPITPRLRCIQNKKKKKNLPAQNAHALFLKSKPSLEITATQDSELFLLLESEVCMHQHMLYHDSVTKDNNQIIVLLCPTRLPPFLSLPRCLIYLLSNPGKESG